MKLEYELCCVEHGGKNTDIIYCRSKKEMYKKAKEIEATGEYEAVIPQANNGEEIIDL